MGRASLTSENGRRTLKALAGVAVVALTTLGCDNSMTFKAPTAPDWPGEWPVSEPGIRRLQISGTLETQEGACLEATVLYDGVELAGSRSRCQAGSGCTRLELSGFVPTDTGHHTISFQVLRQSKETLDYFAGGTVFVSRERLAFGGVALPLGPAQARLEAGGAVTFDLDFAD